MNRLEKIILAIEKGITCNPNTGEVFGLKGKVLKSKTNTGYYRIQFFHEKKREVISSHQFIWYFVNKKVAKEIDHINNNRLDNRIENLREVTHQENTFNRTCKGYSYNKKKKKFKSLIKNNGISYFLGYYNTENEARQAYLDAKKIYHKI